MKNGKVYAFIDSQNLNLGVSNDIHAKGQQVIYKGWKLDFAKFRIFLREKYEVEKAYLFIGLLPGNESLYKSLQEYGYILILKPTLTRKEFGVTITKGNVDAELVLYTSAVEFKNYNSAVIVSGDGDFKCLYEFLISKNKLRKIIIPNRNRYSLLLRPFSKYFDFVSNKRSKLEKKVSMTN